MRILIRFVLGAIIILAIGIFLFFPALFSLLGQKIYWFELLFLVLFTWGYNFSSIFILEIALGITALGGLLNIFIINELAEVTLRAGLVFWVVGLFKTLIEYKRNEKD